MSVRTEYRIIQDNFRLDPEQISIALAELEPSSVRQRVPLVWSKAQDYSVFDDFGNRWIDMTSGIFVANAGHSNPEIKAALKRQIDSDLLFSYNYPTRLKRDFLQKFKELLPSELDTINLLGTGSEALDVAYKLVRNFGNKHSRRKIVTFRGSYHGRGLSNDLICGNPAKASWSGISDPDVVFLDFPYDPAARFPVEMLPEPSQIAGFFLETFQGWGAWFYPEQYMRDLYRFARGAGALVCFDEMQAGFYRLGPLFGYMTYGPEIQPDIVCVGKGISSSLPMSAVISSRGVMDSDPKADLHGTHSGNLLCCAAALANLEFLSGAEFQRKLRASISAFESRISKLRGIGGVRSVNVRGMIAALIFDDEPEASAVVAECLENGVLAVRTNRNSVKLGPPLTIPPAAIEEAAEVLEVAILRVHERLFP